MIHWLREVLRYVRTPYGAPPETSQAIREEVLFHLTENARDEMRRGVAATEACDASMARFGDVDKALQNCHEVAARDYARCHRLHLIVTAASLAAIGILGFYVLVDSKNDSAGDGDLIGRVLDEDRRPIGGAHVLAVVKTWPRQAFRQQAYAAISRSDGSFELQDVYPIDQQYEIQIAVVAEGQVLQSSYVDLRQGQLDPLEFRMTATAPLIVRFESPTGAPLEGVEVFPCGRGDSAGDRDMLYFCSAGPVIQRSDAAGRVRLPFFSAGDRASIYARPPDGDWNSYDFHVATVPGQIVVRPASP